MMTVQVQLNLLGQDVKPQPQIRRGKEVTMQMIYGTSEKYQCGNCAHLIKMHHGRTVYKCLQWKFTPDSRTDIPPEQMACGKYKEEI